MPTLLQKKRVKLAWLAKPRSRPIEVTGSSVSVSRTMERSMRSVLRYMFGVMPMFWRNSL